MEQKTAILGGDARMAALAVLLENDGETVRTWGIGDDPTPISALGEVAGWAEKVILPVPLCRKTGYLNCRSTLALGDLWALLKPQQRIYAGSVRAEDAATADKRGLTLCDYFTDESLMIRNAIPTAEGAIEAAMSALPVTLHRTECLVIGFGRIGKVLAQRLHALGANVSVSARKRSDLAWIDAFGYRPLRTTALAGKVGEFRAIFNTVPQCVLDDTVLEELRRDCVLIELASQPGFSETAAQGRGLRCIRAGGLPGRVAPETAADAIRRSLYRIWEEEV